MDYTLLNGLSLAYVGDVIYEKHIRIYLIDKGLTKVDDLHKRAIKYTSSKGQFVAIKYLLDNNVITEDEKTYFKRGRNQTTSKRKSATQEEYQLGTGFEALVGYLYLTNQIDRLEEIINISIKVIEGEV